MIWHNEDSMKQKEARMFSNLTSFSVNAYKNWGITDSIVAAGLGMKEFMNGWGGEGLKNKLFNSITELHMSINEKELIDVNSALLAMGYKRNKNNFSHPINPGVYINVTEEKGKSKYSKVRFKLNRSVPDKEIVFSPIATLQLKDDDGWFLFK